MKSNVTGLAIVGSLLLIGGAAGLFAYPTGSAETGRTIAVYKSPT